MDGELLRRVYAGILGKIVGVYLGRPIEGWPYSRIKEELGYVDDFVHQQQGGDVVVIDDDISGTLVFLRALREHGYCSRLTSQEVGETWLNQLIDRKTILWWGGYGLSSEHTAYLNLKRGIQAPLSGSKSTNGAVIAEQIGAQIFIDGWAMVCPGQPDKAAKLASEAARVSHDGVAVHAAMLLAVMESAAFFEKSVEQLIEGGLRYLPPTSQITMLVHHLRQIRQRESDWEQAFREVSRDYNYQRYPGVCHVIPNHAIVMLALLYAGDDFRQAMRIACTLGWDTDCNAANVGCFTGIRLGLTAFDNTRYRDEIADLLYLTSAEGGSASDALRETWEVVNTAAILGFAPPPPPLPRYHFSLPGARQGFASLGGHAHLSNPDGKGLRVSWQEEPITSIATPSFFQENILRSSHYSAIGTPEVYSGQILKWKTAPHATPTRALIEFYQGGVLQRERSSWTTDHEGCWVLPDTQGAPILRLGLELRAEEGSGTCTILFLDITGEAQLSFHILAHPELSFVDRGWISSSPQQMPVFNAGLGTVLSADDESLLYTGTTGWKNYRIQSTISSDLAACFGLAIRIRGLANYYALLFGAESCQLIKVRNGKRTLLATSSFHPQPKNDIDFAADGDQLTAILPDGSKICARDADDFLHCGAAGYIVQCGTLRSDKFIVQPVNQQKEKTSARQGEGAHAAKI